MSVSTLFIRRPVATTLLMACMLAFGWVAYRQLPVSDLPNIDAPTIQVSASLPGAKPETMASSVATPLEREFSTIAGVEAMSSTSLQSSTQITLDFALTRNIDAAAQDVQAAIARAQGKLPTEMPSPPSYRKVNPADQPVLFLAVVTPSLPLYVLNQYADTVLGQRISMLPGVAQVVIYGSQKYAVRVQFDPRSLAAKGIGLDEVAKAVQERNVNMPTGVISGPDQAPTIDATGQLMDASAYRDAIVAYRQGNPVRLDQLATVIDSVENDRTAASFYTVGEPPQRSIVLAVQRQPGANTIAVVDSVHALLAQLKLPGSVRVETLYDRSVGIKRSVDDVKFTLLLTLVLVTGTIFCFLRSLRATFIPAIAMPLSIVGTFGVMYLLGYSVDNLSLMALTLSVGFVVDDAIVVLENIVRHMEMGKSPMRAALDGSAEIGFTVASMTLSLVAVFIPVLFMGGLLGRLLNEFSVTIAVAILLSGAVSLTLTPMLCSRWLKTTETPHGSGHGRFYRATEKIFDAAVGLYGATLKVALRHRALVLLASAAILAATFWMFTRIDKGFLANEDQARIFIQSQAVEGTSFAAMTRYQQALAAIVAQDPDVESFMSSIGSRGGQATGTNVGTIFIKLRDRPPRTRTVEEVIAALRPKLNDVPGAMTFLQNPPTIRIGGQIARAAYLFTLQGPDTAELFDSAPKLVEQLRKLDVLKDVSSDLQLGNPEVHVEIDRDKAAALGVTPAQVELALSTAFGTRQVSTIYAPQDSYQVIAEVSPEFQSDPSWLSAVYVRGAGGTLIPLTAVSRVSNESGPLSVNHSGQSPSVTISFNLAPGVSLGSAIDAVTATAATTLPAGIITNFGGTAQVFQSSLVGMGTLLLLAILVTYAVMGILYESFVHPITILSALPFAGFGALATLMLTKTELGLYGFVGIILLVGLVKKNGIMMVDFAIKRRRDGADPVDAIYDACMVRFRPIMMTTLSALLGTLPLALGVGAGAEGRRPLGLAVVGGLLFSQFVTLYATPVFYVALEHLSKWLGFRAAGVTVEVSGAEGSGGPLTAPGARPAAPDRP